jgi:DinB family protein
MAVDIIKQLEITRDRTLERFSLPDHQLDLAYGPGKWTVRFVLHHLADAETVLYERIRRIISEPRQVMYGFAQAAWAKQLDYEHLPLDLSRQIYTAVRAGMIYQARAHYEKSGHLEFVHSETGVRTLKMEFDKVAAHNQHHLQQIEMALRGGSL